jgi:hypothetical protein
MRSPWYAGRIGHLITAVGVVHVASTPVFFPEAVRGVIEDGVFGAVGAEPRTEPVRTAGFWYAMAGAATVAFGWMTDRVERRGDPLPAALPAVLASVGVVGLVLDPKSGFGVFLPLAVIARASRRRGSYATTRNAASDSSVAPSTTTPAAASCCR